MLSALSVDGTFWFETGEHTRKGRNLARDPRCSLSLATHGFDLVVEGTAEAVRVADIVAVKAQQREQGWPAQVDASGTALTAEFGAPSRRSSSRGWLPDDPRGSDGRADRGARWRHRLAVRIGLRRSVTSARSRRSPGHQRGLTKR